MAMHAIPLLESIPPLPEEVVIRDLIQRFQSSLDLAAPDLAAAARAISEMNQQLHQSFHFNAAKETKAKCCTKFIQPKGSRVFTWDAFEHFASLPPEQQAAYKRNLRRGDGRTSQFRYCANCPVHPEREPEAHPGHDCKLRALAGIESQRREVHERPNPVIQRLLDLAMLEPARFHQLVQEHQGDPRGMADALYPGGMALLDQMWQAMHQRPERTR